MNGSVANTQRLVFVYNADSGVFNLLADIAHKALSPDTYQCQLCKLTHGLFKVRQSWLDYLSHQSIDMRFLHRDEFIQQTGRSTDRFPAVFIEREGEFECLIDAEQIASLDTPEALMRVIDSALKSV